MNKIEGRSNTEVFQPNRGIRLELNGIQQYIYKRYGSVSKDIF